MGGGDKILERATPARSYGLKGPVLGFLWLLFLAHGSLWNYKWAVGRNGGTDEAERGMELYWAPYNWAAWRDLSNPGASHTLINLEGT